MKKVLILATSPRKNGNSTLLAQEFQKGAQEAGNNAEIIYLCEKNINFCKGCLSCIRTKKCIIDDDMGEILEKFKTADVIVFATPIYYYEMSGQMKTFIDRTNPLFESNYPFRDIYLLATAADTGEYCADGAIKGLEGWIACFGKTRLKGVIKGFGVTAAGDIKGHKALVEAYNAGKNI